MNLTEKIKDYGLQIGFAATGITTMESLDFFKEELASRGHHYDAWSFESNPKKVFPEGKSIVVMAYDYAQVNYPEELRKYLGRAYLARCYKPLPESVHGARMQLMEDFLVNQGCRCYRIANELPIRQLAARAGIINFGKNNFAYVDGVGSFVIMYAIMVDKELEYDAPTLSCKCPPNCTKCMDACPTKAIERPFKLNPTKCVGYNNWMRKIEGDAACDTTVPEELRSLLGSRIHGCDVCQEVCPRNHHKIKSESGFPKERFLELLKTNLNLTDILNMDDDYYKRWVYPVMYNYISDQKIFRRNAVIAMGNTGDAAYIPELEKALKHPEETVRLHAAWALGQIGGERVRECLKNALEKEQSETALNELSKALDALSNESSKALDVLSNELSKGFFCI